MAGPLAAGAEQQKLWVPGAKRDGVKQARCSNKTDTVLLSSYCISQNPLVYQGHAGWGILEVVLLKSNTTQKVIQAA